jgi:hypothetical protein
MLSHFSDCRSAQPFHVIKYSDIHCAIVLSHFSELSHFSLLQCSAIHRAIVLSNFIELSHFYCNSVRISNFFYSTQSFCNLISHFCYNELTHIV